jgi:hypothetical protein
MYGSSFGTNSMNTTAGNRAKVSSAAQFAAHGAKKLRTFCFQDVRVSSEGSAGDIPQ